MLCWLFTLSPDFLLGYLSTHTTLSPLNIVLRTIVVIIISCIIFSQIDSLIFFFHLPSFLFICHDFFSNALADLSDAYQYCLSILFSYTEKIPFLFCLHYARFFLPSSSLCSGCFLGQASHPVTLALPCTTLVLWIPCALENTADSCNQSFIFWGTSSRGFLRNIRDTSI